MVVHGNAALLSLHRFHWTSFWELEVLRVVSRAAIVNEVNPEVLARGVFEHEMTVLRSMSGGLVLVILTTEVTVVDVIQQRSAVEGKFGSERFEIFNRAVIAPGKVVVVQSHRTALYSPWKELHGAFFWELEVLRIVSRAAIVNEANAEILGRGVFEHEMTVLGSVSGGLVLVILTTEVSHCSRCGTSVSCHQLENWQ